MKPILFDDLTKLDLGKVATRSVEKLRRDLGSKMMGALEDPSIIEIMVNPDTSIWVEDKTGMHKIGTIDAGYSESLIMMVASCVKESVNASNPVIECELPYHGARFEGVIPPVVANPSITIRKHPEEVYTLDDYVASGIMTELQKFVLEGATKARKNILVGGSTGSGKTTLMNAIIKSIEDVNPEHRLLVLEDTNELQISAKNNVIMRTSSNFSMLQALKVCLRKRPDRIVVGEVRDGSALTLLKSWATGHVGGSASCHCNNAYGALTRLELLISEVSVTPMHQLIAEAIDIVVFIERDNSEVGRSIKEVISVDGYSDGRYQITPITGERE